VVKRRDIQSLVLVVKESIKVLWRLLHIITFLLVNCGKNNYHTALLPLRLA